MGSRADTVMMKVVEPSPSSETTPASTAVQTTSLTGSCPTARRMNLISGSKSPTSIIVPKKMMAKNSSVAVGANSAIDDMIESTMPSSPGSPTPVADTTRANVSGTRMSASVGASRLVRIRYMNTAIIEKPRKMSIALSSRRGDGRTDKRTVRGGPDG